MKKCEWCDKKAEMWTYRLEDTGKRYFLDGKLRKVEKPDHFIALCGLCGSTRTNFERNIDWKPIKEGDK